MPIGATLCAWSVELGELDPPGYDELLVGALEEFVKVGISVIEDDSVGGSGC